MPDDPPRYGLLHDRYELQEIVGSGGMGTVYRGRDRVLDRLVAVKTIRQDLLGAEFARRFEREATILARLRSPHIVSVYDYGATGDQYFLVTEFYPDGDLSRHLESVGTMAPEEALLLLAQVAEGLADAHEHGVIHRDVKPANILLYRSSGRLRAVLADFGIAVTEDLTFTATGGVVGSPLYMAPERHRGQPATEATDIYAVGCLLVSALTGRPPYWQPDWQAAYQAASAHLDQPVPTVPPELPRARELDALLADCMAKRPEDRIASAAELAERMRSLAAPPVRRPLAESTVLTPVPTGDETVAPAAVPAPRSSRVGRTPVLVLAALLLGAMVTGGALWAGRDSPDDATAAAGDLGDETAGSSPAGPTTTTVDTPASDPPAPVAPAEPDVRRVSGPYRVTFAVSMPAPVAGTTYDVEREDDGWSATAPRFTVPTAEPGTRTCTRLRLVAVTDGQRTPGAPRRTCAASQERTIELFAVPAECDPTAVGYPAGFSCSWFDVQLSGFRPDSRVRLLLVADGQPAENPPTLPIDARGTYVYGARRHPDYGPLPGGVAIPDANQVLVIEAGAESRTFTLDDYRS